ncbi:hypothetical protein [Microvirga soli]|uniref:hypothetical protein n=1 Tax=Microvirga soli TaxID=1854496 RepID=UPI00191D6012|nr:hypothetical protein [Microvirga soli]
MRLFLIISVCLAAIPVGIIAVLTMAMWLSDHTHEFGPLDPRYVLLIHGTDVARLDLLEPISGSVRYIAQGEEGNSPARAFMIFKTGIPPEQVAQTYETRCISIGLNSQREPQEGNELVVSCDGSSSELGIRASRSGDVTDVMVGGWLYQRR